MQAALDLLADLMTNSRECLREGLVLLLRLMFALEPQLEFRWRLQPEAIIRRVTFVLLCVIVSGPKPTAGAAGAYCSIGRHMQAVPHALLTYPPGLSLRTSLPAGYVCCLRGVFCMCMREAGTHGQVLALQLCALLTMTRKRP